MVYINLKTAETTIFQPRNVGVAKIAARFARHFVSSTLLNLKSWIRPYEGTHFYRLCPQTLPVSVKGKGRVQTITLSTHRNLYRQQICAIFFLFSALEAEIIISLGLSWPFFFLLKRLFTITINYSRTECMMHREGYNNSRRDC